MLTTEVDVALDDPDADAPALREALVRLHPELVRTRRLVESLLHLSRAETIASREPHDLAGDPALLDRFVLNLVENAWRYNTDGGLVRVTTGVTDGAAQLRVENDGPALTAADVPALFARFHRGGAGSPRARGDAQADGHGLGLAIALPVVETHGGILDAQTRPGGGLLITARFRLTS